MSTPYFDQWSRIKALWERHLIPSADLVQLGKRHSQWFDSQQIQNATAVMTHDLQVFADHIEQFGTQDTPSREATS